MDALSCALFPDICLLCGDPLARLTTIPVCDFCWTQFPALADSPDYSETHCACCGALLTSPASLSSAYCRACRMATPPFVRAVAYGLYDSQMREAIHAFKFDRVRVLAVPLGQMLAQTIETLKNDLPDGMLIVPVPLHRAKRRLRGFNQARTLATSAVIELRKTQPTWQLSLAKRTLIRHKLTEPQAGLSPRERRINLRGAFIVSDTAAVENKNILLVDDIMTTGATARSAASALIEAGAASVRVATLSRALSHTLRRTDDDGTLGEVENKRTRKMDGRLGHDSRIDTTQ
jgi:ComF family protein